jgi:hypothetical protein
MKKILTITIFFTFFLLNQTSYAQNMADKIEAAKIGIITQKINLTPEQSKPFWATYTQYNEEKKKVRRELLGLYNGSNTASDEQIGKYVEKMLDLKAQEVELDKKYYKEFQKSISVRQIFELYKAEIAFRNMLVEKLVKRAGKRGGKMNSNDDLGEGLD